MPRGLSNPERHLSTRVLLHTWMRSFDKTNFAGRIQTQLAGLWLIRFRGRVNKDERNIGVPELRIEKNRDAKKKTPAFEAMCWAGPGVGTNSRAVAGGRKAGKSSPDPADLFANRFSNHGARLKAQILYKKHAIFLFAQSRDDRVSKG